MTYMVKREIPGTNGCYSVTDDGRVWSERRLGTSGGWLSPCWRTSGHAVVALVNDGKQRTRFVHRLVLEAFVGPCPPGMECRHLDGDPSNNRLSNLAWGTRSENVQDQIRHGVHRTQWVKKTHCGRGHEFTPENTHTRVGKSGRPYQVCRACDRDDARETRRRKKLAAAQ